MRVRSWLIRGLILAGVAALAALAWLANSSVAKAFGGLKAGQAVMLGSVTPPVWLDAPASVLVDFSPLPPVQLRLN